jgi:tRNA (guanine-N7-)-methyltransferase
LTGKNRRGTHGFSRPGRAAEAFFGRRKTKPLSDGQERLWASLLPRLRLDLGKPAPASLGSLFPGVPERIFLEIGFGGGEHLAHEALRFPGTGFIGAEGFVNGVARMLQHAEAGGIENLRIHDGDALVLLDWLPGASIDRIDILYPDPWPKKRHWKRRFVSPENLDRMARVLKPGGIFRFASDMPDYIDWTVALCAGHAGFGAPLGGVSLEPFEGWKRTRYEAKAVREGRQPRYLVFRRNVSVLKADRQAR